MEKFEEPDEAFREEWKEYILNEQKDICESISKIDGSNFIIDEWKRDNDQGGGISCVLQNSHIIDKAGINVSYIKCSISDNFKKSMSSRNININNDMLLSATGISIIIHPKNPKAPTIHCNYRFLQLINDEKNEEKNEKNEEKNEDKKNEEKNCLWWFGGGTDLTPSYLFDDDARQFHGSFKDICDGYNINYYPKFKKWCDDYFWLSHRNESRGVGGIFFDDLNDMKPSILLNFCKDCLKNFKKSYNPILIRRIHMDFTENEKIWQQLRRGRYVEFNLVHDRGTKFGFNTPNCRIGIYAYIYIYITYIYI
eukprot:GHVL01039555.1.p1 GENE.GHVL01039555.1~~GHVL01039555.1.p1  ORF type:complete len:310 (+),score=107.10 GHVL01039555.1:533-1462(+)